MSDNVEKIYFLDKDDRLRMAKFSYDSFPENPWAMSPFGELVMEKQRNYSFNKAGAEVDSIEDFMRGSVDDAGYYREAELVLNFPKVGRDSISDAFLAGVPGEERYFDRLLFQQAIDAFISAKFDDKVFERADAGIPLDSNQKYEDRLVIDVKTRAAGDRDEKRLFDGKIDELFEDVLSYCEELGVDVYYRDYKYDWSKASEDLDRDTVVEKFCEKYAAVIPLYFADGGSQGVEFCVTNSLDSDWCAGFVAVGHDNKEFLDYMDRGHSFDETVKWAEGLVTSMIHEYEMYLNGNCYVVNIHELNPDTLEWDDVDAYGNVLCESFDDALRGEYGKDIRIIDEEEARKIASTVTPRFKEHVFGQFAAEVRELLPKFDNDVNHAAGAVFYSMRRNGDRRRSDALSDYLKEKGCVSGELTTSFVTAAVADRDFQFSLMPKDGCRHCVFVDRNPRNLSQFGSVVGGIVINEGKKCFAVWEGVDAPPDGMKKRDDVEKVRSGAAVRNMARELAKKGYAETTFDSDFLRGHQVTVEEMNRPPRPRGRPRVERGGIGG